MALKIGQVESVFLSLVRSGIWECDFDAPQDFCQWRDVVNLAKVQSLLGIVGNEILKNNGKITGLENDLRLKLRSFKVSNIMAVNKINETTADLFNRLKDNCFHPILLKGSGLSCNYPVPELRQGGDIDVFVGMEDYVKSYELFKNLTDKIERADDIWVDKNYNMIFNDVEVEVHRLADEYPSASLDKVFQKFSKEYLMKNPVKVILAGSEIETPSDTFNALYVFMHMFRHFMIRGVGLRQVCDWVLFLSKHKDGIDQEVLKDILTQLHLLKPWQDFAAMTVNYLGASPEDIPFYRDGIRDRRQRKIIIRILTEGNFGKQTAYYKDRSDNYLVAKITSFFRHMGRFLQLASLYPTLVFPYMSTIMKFGFGGIGRDIKAKINGR